MSIDPSHASAAQTEPYVADEESRPRDPSDGSREGLGVFRALVFMLIFYLALGSFLWFVWHASRHRQFH